MNTYAIHHEVGIKASPEAVYQALTDTKRLAGWWISDPTAKAQKSETYSSSGPKILSEV